MGDLAVYATWGGIILFALAGSLRWWAGDAKLGVSLILLAVVNTILLT